MFVSSRLDFGEEEHLEAGIKIFLVKGKIGSVLSNAREEESFEFI
jgi:hypothetical protein